MYTSPCGSLTARKIGLAKTPRANIRSAQLPTITGLAYFRNAIFPQKNVEAMKIYIEAGTFPIILFASKAWISVMRKDAMYSKMQNRIWKNSNNSIPSVNNTANFSVELAGMVRYCPLI